MEKSVQVYVFLGSEPRFYSRWEDQTFTANPGDERAFVDPPTDGLWALVPADEPKAIKPAPSKSEESK